MDLPEGFNVAMQEKVETRSRIGISHDEEVKSLGNRPLPILAQSAGLDSTVYFVQHELPYPALRIVLSFVYNLPSMRQ
jgi:hypothetical protein